MSNEKQIGISLAVLVATLLTVVGLITVPWVFERYLAIDRLLDNETVSLKWFSGSILTASLLLIVFRKRIDAKISMVLLGMCILVFTELGYRFYCHQNLTANEKWELEMLGLKTLPEYTAYEGHPFVQYTRRRAITYRSSSYKNVYTYNSQGFNDIEWTREKPLNTFRIACLGASTTERGYPVMLEKVLDSNWTVAEDVQVLNFGIGGWTSAHSLVNFLLNVVEYDPDMIVIHHGWNEASVRGVPDSIFRSDYSHVFTYWHEPVIPDGFITRHCLIYRTIKQRLDRDEPWMFLDRNTVNMGLKREADEFADPSELEPYRRNLKYMIDLALLRNIQVVLPTMPYSTDTTAGLLYQWMNIDQCNRIGRELRDEYGDQVIFTDLDSMMTGKNKMFIDLAHMTQEGELTKATAIAEAILSHRPTKGF